MQVPDYSFMIFFFLLIALKTETIFRSVTQKGVFWSQTGKLKRVYEQP